jgi:drug/metabolite transporter (DMT)-like permease
VYTRPHVLLLSAVVVWGWTFVATKILVAELAPVEILALRLAVGLPFLVLVLLGTRVPLRFEREDIGPLLVAGAILTAHYLIQIAGLVTTTATNSGWIIAVSPLVLATLSFFILRERLGATAVAGIATATAGVAILVSRGHVTDVRWLQSTGDWLVLASAHTWAFFTIATRDLARRRHPLAVTFAILVVAAALTTPLLVASVDVDRVRSLSPRGIAAVVFLAIPGLAMGQWFWQEGVARLGAARAGLYLYVEPIATMALAVPLLGEPFGLATAVGGSMVLVGVYLGQRPR